LIGIVYAVPLFFTLRDVPRDRQPSATASPGSSLRELLGNPSFVLLVLYFTLPALAGWVVRDWMPSILKQEFGIGQGKAGVSATLYWQVAAIIGAIVGGWLADSWMKRTNRGRIYVSAIGMSLIVPAMFGVGFSPQTGQLWVAVLFLILFGLGWGFFDCNNMPILCQITRPELRATGYGLMNMVSISCGGLADWGFGIMRDGGWPLSAIFGVFASCAILSVVLVLLIRPNSEMSDRFAGAEGSVIDSK
jgi:sugar phosphate permease